jgi:MFS family permease
VRQDRSPRSLGRTFEALLVATAVTNLGDGVRLATLPLLATTLTGSPLAVAGVTAAQFLPWLVFAPIGGVVVDRSDRRRLILRTQGWRAIIMVTFGILVLADVAAVWMLFVVAFAITVGEILVDPSVVATVPTLVRREDLDRANGRISSVEIVTNDLVGAPVGAGLFLAAPWLPFLLDGLTYFGSILPFRRLPRTPRPPRPETSVRELAAEVPEGLRWIRGHQMLRPWTAGVAIFNVGAAAGFSLLVLLILDTHGGTEPIYAITLTVAAAAAAVFSAVAPGLANRFGRPAVMLTFAAAAALAMVAVGMAGGTLLVAVFWAINGGATGVLFAIGRGYIQRYCPTEILGRAAIASRTITRTAFVVGALGGGALATAASLPTVFLTAGAIQIVALLPMGFGLRHDHD